MPDDLRTRITKAIADAQFAFDNGDPYNGPEDAEVLADAVITELGLRVEYGMGAQGDYSDNPEIHPVTKHEMERRTWYGEYFTFRYVTDWKADDA